MGHNDDLIKAGTTYMAGRAIMSSAAHNLHKQAEQMAKSTRHIYSEESLRKFVSQKMLAGQKQEAYDWLTYALNSEVVDYVMDQKERIIILDELLERCKAKFNPIYEIIGIPMPENIANASAEELCKRMGVEYLTQEYYDNYKKELKAKEQEETLGLIFRGILLVIGLILLAMPNSCS